MNPFMEALLGEKKNKTIFSPLIGEWDIEWVDGKGTDGKAKPHLMAERAG